MERNRFSQSIVVVVLSLSSGMLFAGTADLKLKGISLDDDKSTSITIKKGKQNSATYKPRFKFLKGDKEVMGEPNSESRAASKSWKEACSEWKEEVKDLNKKNEVIELDCGSPTTVKADYGQKLVKSSGKYQIKVQIRGNSPEVSSEEDSEASDQDKDDDEDEVDEVEGE